MTGSLRPPTSKFLFTIWCSCWLWNGLTQAFELKLPPQALVQDLAKHYSLIGILLHVPNTDVAIQQLVRYQKNSSNYGMTVIDTNKIRRDMLKTRLLQDLHLVYGLDNVTSYLGSIFESRPPKDMDFWLIDITNIDDIKSQLSSLPLDLDDQIYLCRRNDQNGTWELLEAYKISPDWPATILDYGQWSEEGGLQVSTADIWRRRADLQGLQFKVATLYSAPYVTKMVQNEVTGSWEMDGMFSEVFHSLQEIMNFTYTLRPPPDGEWGADLGNGSWTGMVGMLATKQIDIAATDFTVTMERSVVMTFAEPITQIYHSLFIKNPTGRPNYTAYTEPLHNMSWVFIFILVLITPPFLVIAVRNGPRDRNRSEFTFGKSYVFSASVLTFARSWSVSPVSGRGKLAFGSMLVGGTLIYYHWEAMLISYLATRVIVLPFKSLPELIDTSAFKITVTPGSSYADSFKFSPDPIWQKAWKERIKPEIDTYPKGEGHVDKIIAEPDFAMYDNFFAVRTYSAYADCEIIAIPQKYDFKPYAYGFQKDSAYLGPFNFYLKQLRERGATKQILEKYESRPQICPDYSGQPLGFDNCFTAFICLLCGLGLGLLLLVLETSIGTIYTWTGLDFSFIDSYGRLSLGEEEDLILQDDSIEEKAKSIIQFQRRKIFELEQTLLGQNVEQEGAEGSPTAKRKMNVRMRKLAFERGANSDYMDYNLM